MNFYRVLFEKGFYYMAKEPAQRHIEESTTSSTPHRTSAKDALRGAEMQPLMRDSPRIVQVLNQILDLVIRGTCVWGGIVGFQRTGNELFFLLCIGIAYREIGIFAAIQLLTSTLVQFIQKNPPSSGTLKAEEHQEKPEVIN